MNFKSLLSSFAMLCGLLATKTFAQSNEGTEFWFSFMEHRDVGVNSMVAMITSQENTSGTISFPATGWELPFDVAANSVRIVTYPEALKT